MVIFFFTADNFFFLFYTDDLWCKFDCPYMTNDNDYAVDEWDDGIYVCERQALQDHVDLEEMMLNW